jgi:hypothetical protein
MSAARRLARTPVRRRAVIALSLALILANVRIRDRGPVAQSSDSPCDIRTSERVVAVGDVHGAYDRFVGILRAAGLVDSRARWTGGRAVLVQTGDVLDRGPHSRRVLDLLRRLEREASRAGGRVHALVGNHEVMRMVGDWRYVSAEELAAFRDPESSDRRTIVLERAAEEAALRAKQEKRPFDEGAFREQFLRDVPLGSIEMRQAFDVAGEYGKWLRARHSVIKVNGIVFLHGGISEEVAALGCDTINATVRRELAAPPPTPEQLLTLLSSGPSGPLWYRGLAQEPEDTFAPKLDAILKALRARAIVIGHTPVLPGRIATRFGGRVVQIDTGMLDGDFYPEGVASALEIQRDALTAIYEDRRERIEVPALGLAANEAVSLRPAAARAGSSNSTAASPRSAILFSKCLTMASRRARTAAISSLVRLFPTASVTASVVRPRSFANSERSHRWSWSGLRRSRPSLNPRV